MSQNQNLYPEFNGDSSTRFAEGAFNSIKFTMVHGLLYAPFFAREKAFENKTSFVREYGRHMVRASLFYTVVLSYTFGSRTLLAKNRERFLFDMQYNSSFLRKNRTACDLIMYFGMSLPLGLFLNNLHTGRIIKGTFSYSLILALFMRVLD